MRKSLLVLIICILFSVSVGYSQKILNEIQIELTPAQKKQDPAFSIYNQKTGGITIFCEPKQLPYVRGEKRKFERYEIQLDKDLNLFSGDFKILETRLSVRPRIFFSDCGISYYTWVNYSTENKSNKLMLQMVRFDLDNNITDHKSIELCDEKGFISYRVVAANGKLIVLAQYETIPSKAKNLLKKTNLLFKRIDITTLEILNESEIVLSGNKEIGLAAVMIHNDKIFLAGPDLSDVDSVAPNTYKRWCISRLNSDGTEEKRNELSFPGSNLTAGSAFFSVNKDFIYLVGEYGDMKEMQKIPDPPYGSSENLSVKCNSACMGIYVKKLDSDLQQITSSFLSFKEDVLPKLKKGNKGFAKKDANFNFQNFHFLDDGSFYITAEMYNKIYRSEVTVNDFYNNYNSYTDYNYLDGLVFKFNSNSGLEWLLQFDRDNYTLEYSGFIKDKLPQENGKLESFLLQGSRLAILYNTPGKKYSAKRFGLSEVIITPQGEMSNPVEFTSEQQFELLDGGTISIGNNEILAVGTNTKTNNIWIKRINIFE